jgi:serine phosphatase RsbU (regulator of sigma subunit)
LHIEEHPQPKRPQLEEVRSLGRLCQSFQLATGWTLEHRAGRAPPPGSVWSQAVGDDGERDQKEFLAIEARQGGNRSGRFPPPDAHGLEAVQELAAAVAQLLQELHQTRCALWQREAELATSVPGTPRLDEESHLAARLEAVLKAGGEAVKCQAAAVYLLDDATRKLKLRSCWGLPKSRFLAPPRPLRGAAADLEALVGHAVVIEDATALPSWSIPEEFQAAVCVPVSSPATPLGTLWMFSERRREFSMDETNLVEIVAGRIAADLEREMLLHETLRTKNLARQVSHAAGWQQNRLPRIKPLLPGWQVAGCTLQADDLGGDFHDWFVLPDGTLAIAIGDSQGKMFEAALTAASIHTALRAHAGYRHSAQQMAERINETLWTASVGDQFASLFYALIQPDNGSVEYVAAGHVQAAIIGESLRMLRAEEGTPLGTQPESDYPAVQDRLEPGESIVVVSEGVQRALRGSRGQALWRMIQSNRERDPRFLVDKARGLVERLLAEQEPQDVTILILKRTGVTTS